MKVIMIMKYGDSQCKWVRNAWFSMLEILESYAYRVLDPRRMKSTSSALSSSGTLETELPVAIMCCAGNLSRATLEGCYGSR